MAARGLTTAESDLIRWLLAHCMPQDAKPAPTDLSTALVARYDESECLRFEKPVSSGERGFHADMFTFDDVDGVSITAFLTFDPRGRMQELDLWKADDSRIVGLRDPSR
ncbi:hypothetical protein KK101_01840 [Curtobacterium flaccumfaciens pv. oortii]|uniref:DUF6984 family protein n=1 Tax=Curtobacterium flaccumfaciens TaxID=2035 RepID=UPI001BDEDD82|nr:hypothetical protein [Curtobacterium flaccumfaciens]MBT1621428.1 hypothetical protein [Curtobacterium flaccumfaciens pv. oortii]